MHTFEGSFGWTKTCEVNRCRQRVPIRSVDDSITERITTNTTSAFSVSPVLWRCWLGGRKGIRPVKKTEWWGAGVVICQERGADLAQLMPLPLTVSCFSKMQIGFTFLIPAHKGVRRILVRGVSPLAAWGEENFENLTTKWCILKYIWINV